MDRAEKLELIKSRVCKTVKYSGYTQRELAEMMGTHHSQVFAWASGRALPNMLNLSVLCEALKINPLWLLGLSERRNL